jgi:hypothetical protein
MVTDEAAARVMRRTSRIVFAYLVLLACCGRGRTTSTEGPTVNRRDAGSFVSRSEACFQVVLGQPATGVDCALTSRPEVVESLRAQGLAQSDVRLEILTLNGTLHVSSPQRLTVDVALFVDGPEFSVASVASRAERAGTGAAPPQAASTWPSEWQPWSDAMRQVAVALASDRDLPFAFARPEAILASGIASSLDAIAQELDESERTVSDLREWLGQTGVEPSDVRVVPEQAVLRVREREVVIGYLRLGLALAGEPARIEVKDGVFVPAAS